MKRFLFILILFAIMLCGCNKSTSFEPNVTQVIEKIEVNETYDPLSFIRNVSNDNYSISVLKDEIDISKIGNYNVTYSISDNNNHSKDLTYLISVVDETKPTIQLITDITTTVNENFILSNFVQVLDNYDVNLTNSLEIDGEYDVSKVGEYQVKLVVSDSSNNTSTKTVTIYVVANDEIKTSNDLVGVYMVDYMDDTTWNPTLVLSDDETFSLTINYCVGLKTFSGTYSESGNNIILYADAFTFDDDDPSSSTITLTKTSDGNLIYENNYGACSPIKSDIFVKR